jgi:hypothetical protein
MLLFLAILVGIGLGFMIFVIETDEVLEVKGENPMKSVYTKMPDFTAIGTHS